MLVDRASLPAKRLIMLSIRPVFALGTLTVGRAERGRLPKNRGQEIAEVVNQFRREWNCDCRHFPSFHSYPTSLARAVMA
jgi:hypothetical protein